MSFHFGEPSSSFKVSIEALSKRKHILASFLALLLAKALPVSDVLGGLSRGGISPTAAQPRHDSQLRVFLMLDTPRHSHIPDARYPPPCHVPAFGVHTSRLTQKRANSPQIHVQLRGSRCITGAVIPKGSRFLSKGCDRCHATPPPAGR